MGVMSLLFLVGCLPLMAALNPDYVPDFEQEIMEEELTSKTVPPPKLGGGDFGLAQNVRISHEESHIHPSKRVYRTLSGNHQPFPDDVSLSFQSMGQSFEFTNIPLLKNIMHDGASMEVMDADGKKKTLMFKHKNYAKYYADGSWVSAMIHSDDDFEATVLSASGDMFLVGKASHLSQNTELQGEEAEAKLAGVADHELVVMKVDTDSSHLLCGVTDKQRVLQKQTPKLPKDHARSLLQVDAYDDEPWTGDVWGKAGCNWGDNGKNLQEIGMHLIADYELSKHYGDGITDYLIKMIADTNVIYRGQLKFSMKLNKVQTLPQGNSETFNNCGNSIDTMLDDVVAYRQRNDYKTPAYGLTAVVNRCWAFGTVGLAYLGTMCKDHGASVSSSKSSSHLLTFAHEIGHNVGGDHSFEEGQGRTGGIMDYGNGFFTGANGNNIQQFHTKYREEQICTTINNYVTNTQDYGWCMEEVENNACGNGRLEEGEDCDSDSACCTEKCKWASGATCETDGDCCISCKPSPDCGWCKWIGNGDTYNGLVSTTVTGKTCQKWSLQTPHAHQYQDFYTSQSDHNYCRNPVGVNKKPFCYTTDSATRFEYCDVGTTDLPKCGGPESQAPPTGVVPTAPPGGDKCTTSPSGWTDTDGSTCEEYADIALCKDGAINVPQSDIIAWFHNSCGVPGGNCKNKGAYAYEACCECGGGDRDVDSCPTLTPPEGTEGDSCAYKQPGDTCTFACSAGSTPKTSGTRTCTEDFSWSGVELTCSSSGCDKLESPIYAITKECSGFQEDDVCKFECDGGHNDNGFASRTCSSNVWTGVPLVCSPKPCSTLLPPNGGGGNACSDKVHGDTCGPFQCNQNYVPAGDPTRECSGSSRSKDAEWEGDPFTCTLAGVCPELQSPIGAIEQKCVGKTTDETCQFECDTGYVAPRAPPSTNGVAVKDPSIRTCKSDLTWDGLDYICSAIVCSELKAPQHASDQQCVGVQHGGSCTFQCLAGYVASGSVTRDCVEGRWGGDELVCAPMTCPTLNLPENAVGNGGCEGYLEGQSCSFGCPADYSTVGDTTRTCQNGAWSGFTLVCASSEVDFIYIATDWGQCSEPCAGGERTREVTCVDLLGTVVDKGNCASSHPVTSEEPCNEEACTVFSWAWSVWGQCSTTCGGGLARRDVYCETSDIRVDDSYCAAYAKPSREQACTQKACVEGEFHHVFGAWGDCSAHCGGGTRTRTVQCRDYLGNRAMDSCTATPPSDSEDCNTLGCEDIHQWRVCAWEECTATCGGAGGSGGLMSGVTARQVMCMVDEKEVDESLCSLTGAKPTSLLVGCNPQPCTDNNWMTTTWGKCDANKKKYRTDHCHFADGGNALPSDCNPAKKPVLEASCTTTCPGTAKGGIANGAASLGFPPPFSVALLASLAGLLLEYFR